MASPYLISSFSRRPPVTLTHTCPANTPLGLADRGQPCHTARLGQRSGSTDPALGGREGSRPLLEHAPRPAGAAQGAEPVKPSEPETPEVPETVERAEPKTGTLAFQARPDQRAQIEDAREGTGTKKQERTGGIPTLTGITISGIVLILIGSIWLIVEGFKQSMLWGLGLVVFFQFAFPIFTYMHWQETKRPVLVFLAGGALCIIGVLTA